MSCSLSQYEHLKEILKQSNNLRDTNERIERINKLRYLFKQYKDIQLILYTEINDSIRLIGFKANFIIDDSVCDGNIHKVKITNSDGTNLDVYEIDSRNNITRTNLIQAITISQNDYVRMIKGQNFGDVDFSNYILGEGFYPLGLFDLVVKDSLTNLEIKNKDELVTPEIELSVNFSPSIENDPLDSRSNKIIKSEFSLTKDGGNIPFANNSKIIGYGVYELKAKLIEIDIPTNIRTITVKFTLKQELTDLNNLKLSYINGINNEEIKNGSEYQEGLDILQPMIGDRIPNDLYVYSQILYYNGAEIVYDPNIDVLFDDGDYKLITKIKRKENIISNLAINEAAYSVDFRINDTQASVHDCIVRVINTMDNATIPPSSSPSIVYKNEPVCFDWEEPEGIIVDKAVLMFTPQANENNPYPQEKTIEDFSQASSVYYDYGVYKLILTLKELDSSNGNTSTRNYSVKITYKEKNLDANKIYMVDSSSGRELQDSDNVFYGNVSPTATYLLDDQISYIKEYALYKNGNIVDNFSNGDNITEYGSYSFVMKVIDSGLQSNFIAKTVPFSLREKPLNLYNETINVINVQDNEEITNGKIFEVYINDVGVNTAPLTLSWNYIEKANEKYTLYFNNNVKSNFVKGNSISDIGVYRLHVEFSDPIFPNNKIEKDVVFELRLNLESMKTDPNLSAYLNGVPYTLGTIIDTPGSYNLLVVRKQESNFNYSKKEVNFTIVNADHLQKPLINSYLQPSFVSATDSDDGDNALIEIIYPSYSTIREYRIDMGEWKTYSLPFVVNENCTIYARCKDAINNFYNETLEVVDIIDKEPPLPPELIGFYKTGEQIYHSITPMVKHVYGNTYSATLNGEPFVLGTAVMNENQEIKSYDLAVTVTKKSNGLSNQTTKQFKLDNIPPNTPEITNVTGNEIQGSSSVTPTVTNMTDTVDYECYLNDRKYKLGTPINKPGSYKLSVTAIKKSNGLRRTTVITFIIAEVNMSIIHGRLALLPITLETMKNIKPADNELVVDLVTGDIYIYRDGILISKTKELRERKESINEYIDELNIDLENCVSRVDSLFELKNNVHLTITTLGERVYDMEMSVATIKDNINKFVFDNYDELDKRRKELTEIEKLSNRNAIELENIESLINGKIEDLKGLIGRIASNSDNVAELAYYKSILKRN